MVDLIITTITSVLLSYFVISIWIKSNLNTKILAASNSRSLHQHVIPTGVGATFFLSFLTLCSALYLFELVQVSYFLIILCLGGGVYTVLGLIDDIFDLNASFKLVVQFIISICVSNFLAVDMLNFGLDELLALEMLLISFLLVWFSNAFNFMDGSDGMLSSNVIFICLGVGFFTANLVPQEITFSLSVLVGTCAAFLYFNAPPARIFMGDSGSLFLGFAVPFIVFYALSFAANLLIPVLIIAGYLIADTITTLIVRFLKYGVTLRTHKDHAYQQITQSKGHKYSLNRVNQINFYWLLPMAILSFIYPKYDLIVLFFAMSPLIIFCAWNGALRA